MISSDWTAVARKKPIEFDFESTPLQVQTDSKFGSGEELRLRFADATGDFDRGISVYLRSQPKYSVGFCFENRTILPKLLNELKKYDGHVWTIEKTNSKLKLFCNGMLIFELETQSSENSNSCKNRWSFDCARIHFRGIDTASDFYRQYTTGEKFID